MEFFRVIRLSGVSSFFNAFPYAGCVCRDSTMCVYILAGVEFFLRSSLTTILDFLRIPALLNSASATLILDGVGFFICSLTVLDFCRASLLALCVCLCSVTSFLPLIALSGVVFHFLSRLLPVDYATSNCCVAFVLVLAFAYDFSSLSSLGLVSWAYFSVLLPAGKGNEIQHH